MSYTVLLVDDEVELLSVLDTFLKDLGYNTITASSGNNAFNLFQSSLVDFVISDIQMSDGNGVDLLKNCSALNQDIPFLLVSGFVDIHLDELKKYGCIDILSKPFDLNKIQEILEMVLGK